jgi:phage terminase large subunit GpA-like protein
MTTTEQLHENFTREIQPSLVGAWQRRIKRKPSVWAREVRRIAVEQNVNAASEAVAYTHDLMPHCVEIMDAADDSSVHRIVIWAGIRDGKTLSVCCNIIGRTVTDAPRNIYSVHPIDDDVARFSNGDIEPMISACLEGYFVEKKSRDSGRTVDFKKFHGGWLRIVNAGSLTKFRGTTVGVMLIHEADAIDREVIEKAMNRTKGVQDAVIVIESTCTDSPIVKDDGTIEYRSNIHFHFDQGDQRKWFVRCRSCGHWQILRYSHFRWPEGRMDLVACHCERCDAAHNEAQWRKMVSGGRWFPTAGLSELQIQDIANTYHLVRPRDPACRSYWRSGFNSLLPTAKGYKTKLHEFVAQGEAAKLSREALRTWTNEIAAELWNPDEELIEPPQSLPIKNNREDYARIDPQTGEEKIVAPMHALVLTCMTDLHGDRLEVEWRAWGRTEESWGLGHFVLFGNTEKSDVWDEWVTHLQRTFPHASGGELTLQLGLIDGGWRADPIAAVLRRLHQQHVPGVSGKLIVCKGVPQWNAVVFRQWATIKDKLKGIHIGTWGAKSLIYERLRWHSSAERPNAGFIHFGKIYSDEFIEQTTREIPVMKRVKGKDVEAFENPEKRRNEALDLLVGNLAAFRRRRWDFDAIEAELKRQGEEKRQPRIEKPREVSRVSSMMMAGGGWRL